MIILFTMQLMMLKFRWQIFVTVTMSVLAILHCLSHSNYGSQFCVNNYLTPSIWNKNYSSITVPCKSTAKKVSFKWSHHRILSTDSKVRTTLHVSTIDSGSERVKHHFFITSSVIFSIVIIIYYESNEIL